MALDPAPKLSYRRQVGFALETTTGTPAAVAGADCVTPVFGGVPVIHYATEKVERETLGNSVSQIQQAAGARSGTATFETELFNGASGVPMWALRLLACCGWQNTAGVWTPLTAPTQTLTIAEWIDGRRRMLSGCMGNFALTLRRGQKGRLRWSFTGVQQPPIDQANPAVTYLKPIAPRAGAVGLTIGGVSTALKLPEIEIDSGNNVILRESLSGLDSAGDATGFEAAYITNRRPTVKASPEALSYATKNWWNDFQTLAQVAFSVQIGAAAGNMFTFAAPKLQLDADPDLAERERMLVDGLQWLACRSADAGDDEMSITFA